MSADMPATEPEGVPEGGSGDGGGVGDRSSEEAPGGAAGEKNTARGRWRRLRAVHRFGFLLKAVRQRYALRRGQESAADAGAVPPGGYGVKVVALDSCVVGDGKVLRASLVLPEGVEGPFPSILMRTPYGRKADFGQAILAKRGFAVLVQDTRGRFSSDGDFVPVQHEREDGPATVAWMRQQPWCNGKVGVTGVSYLGFTAWACLDGAHVDAIVPVMTRSSVRDAIFLPGGAISYELIVLWFYLVLHLLGDAEKSKYSFYLKLLRGQWKGTVSRSLRHAPIGEIDTLLLGQKHEFLQAGLAAHSNPADGFWDDKDTLCHFERVPPCHILTGWYDFFLDGALQDYCRAREKQSRVQLTVGPFNHWSILGSPGLYLETMVSCFDEHLKCAGTREDPVLPVRLYILGHGWRRYADFPPPASICSLWLGADYGLHTTQPRIGLQHSYWYDPSDPTTAMGGPSFNLLNAGARDQRDVESRQDVLVYTSAPARAPFVVVGTVRIRLEVAWEVNSVDFVARLCHVDRGGHSTNLCEGLATSPPSSRGVAAAACAGASDGGGGVYVGEEASAAARGADRGGGEECNATLEAAAANTVTDAAPAIAAGKRTVVEVHMSATAVSLRAGEFLRLHVCSGAHPRWLRNLGSDEPLAVASTFCPGRVRVLAGELMLPLEDARSGGAVGGLAELLGGPAARL